MPYCVLLSNNISVNFSTKIIVSKKNSETYGRRAVPNVSSGTALLAVILSIYS